MAEAPADGVEQVASDAAVQPADDVALLEEERAKHARRAAKFGVEYKEPGRRKDLRHVARKEAALARARPPDFTPGLDLYSEEEIQRRRERAARFNTEDTLASYQPVVDPETIAKRKARAERFGTDYQPEDAAGLMDVDLLESRREPPMEAPRRREAVHLYGVDLMSTKEVLQYFSDYNPVFVEWLDDSSCNVLFRDEFTGKRAIFGLGKPLPPEDVPEGQELAALVDVTQIEKLWHKGPDFVKDGTPIPLIFRLATTEDKRPPRGTHTTRRLWQNSAAKGGRQRQSQQAPKVVHLEGDEEDASMRGERGGRKLRSRKRQHNGDVEMVDAEYDTYHGEADDDRVGKQQRVAPEDLLAERRRLREIEPRVTGLFSAAAAGIALPARQRPIPHDEEAAHGADAKLAQAPAWGMVSYADL